MIAGARLWNDRLSYYSQTNNPTEEILRLRGGRGWLETCGPTAAVNCLAALGVNVNIICPGGWVPQPEEILMDFLTDPRNYGDFRNLGADPAAAPGNEQAVLYPFAVARVFGARAEFLSTKPQFGVLIDILKAGHTLQLCLVSPGHFIAAVAFDDEAGVIIFNDPWPGRDPAWKGDGFNRRMNASGYESNVKDFAVLYRRTS
jgi:hypothetical protein